MRVVAALEPLPVDDPRALLDLDLPAPDQPTGHDLLVRVEAVAVNPLDIKVRRQKYGSAPAQATPRVLGWDAAGVVEAVGPEVSLFRPGDAVYYAGSVQRPGSYAERQLVDERIVGRKPRSLDFGAAAALPLTSITAYEALVDRLGIDAEGGDTGRSLLIIGGAGGVGSMAIQIGKQLGLQVVATASRSESAAWCRELGADQVIDHRQPLRDGLKMVGLSGANYIFNCASTDQYWTQMAEAVAPQGRLCGIVVNEQPLDLKALARKAAGFCWEGMFARSIFQTPDMIEQHHLLCRVADWIDAGKLRGTVTETLSPINAANLRAAHAMVEARSMIGKVVVAGWPS